jgi:hypothetical protein
MEIAWKLRRGTVTQNNGAGKGEENEETGKTVHEGKP